MTAPLRILLFALLLSNLLLLGILFGQLGQSWFGGPQARQTPEQIETSLPPQQRQEFHRILTETQGELAPIRAKIEETRRQSLCILDSDPFDRKAYLAKVAALHTLHMQLMQKLVTAVIEHAPQFSPQERIAFSDLLRPPPPRISESPCQATGH